MLFFAALMMTLGVKAQEGSTVEERGAAKGYYPFAAEVTEMEQITSLDQLTNGMEIMIKHSHEGTDQDDHEGSYLTIYSLPTYGAAHIVFMQEKPVEVGVWTTNTVSAQDGTFKLQSAHGVITNSTCYLGQLGWNLTAEAYLSTTGTAEYVGVYKFVPATDGSGRWNIQCTNNNSKTYLSVTADSKGNPTIGEAYSIDKNCYFEIYRVKEKSTEQVKYVENAQVKLIGPSGNIVTTTHSGWSDFYEFVMYSGSAQSSVNYGVSISNVLYHESENLITASIKYAFPISGNVAKIPVHLCPKGREDLRISIVDGNLKVVEKPANGWVKDKNNQWYIFPKYDNKDFTYAIQNVGTGQYINFTSTYTSSNIITLGQTPSYFTLGANTAGTYLNFEFEYTNDKSATYTYCLYGDIQDLKDYNKNLLIPAYQLGAYSKNSYYAAENFLVSPVSSTELDGVPAIGFTRYFHEDAYFWDGGEIADENVPDAVKANRASSSHEGYNAGVHKVFTAETGITVTQTGSVTVQFDFISGKNTLQILGVDIVKRDDARTVVEFDYHLGKAGNPSQNNLYVLNNVEAEDYYIRYWVCNRTDLDGWEGHNLKNVRGKIEVKGANYDYTPIDALENGQFPVNTTWYRMRLQDGLGKYISAHPDYMDEDNYLKLSNNTPPSDYAGLWAIVGNETDGYKFYNRAWGPEYAMKTTGENGGARTFMAPANEATSYDIVRDLDAEDISTRYKYYVKVHGTDHNYLNDHANNGYLRTWNTAEAGTNADGSGSVMTFETLYMEVFEANTVALKNKLIANWNPWVGNSEVREFVASIPDDFAQLMLKRNDFSILDGKVFKFVNKGETEKDARRGCVLRVDADNNMAGVVSQGETIDDFLQIVDNGNGTFKLLHLATNKYFQSPSAHTITENAADAAAYSYKVYGDEKQALCFVSGNEMMHLSNWDYTTMHYDDINNGASRWDVICDVDAQELSGLITQAKALYAATQATAYQENVGVPGYADAGSTGELNDALSGLAGKTFDDAETALTNAMTAVTAAEKKVFFPTDCYFTITNRNQSVIFDENYTSANCNDDYLWCTTSVDATNPNHLWGFYKDEVTGEYYLYNVGKALFANSKGKGGYGDTWIFSSAPVAITMEAMDTPYFHIKGDGKTMSVSEGHVGPVITYDAAGDKGIPMQFKKGAVKFDAELLKQLEGLNAMQLKPGFYTLNCGENYYLNDDVVVGDNMRSLTALTSDKIKNIFYLTEDQELVGYASGYGFTYANCNTGKPEEGYNTFTFSKAAGESEYLVKAEDGKSEYGWADRYLTAKDGKLVVNDGVKKDATAWKIEAVTELPVKLTHASKNRGAYGTIYSPVALKLVDGVRAYTGYVTTEDGENVLVLEEFTGVVPANTGAVLWKSDATANVVVNFEITDEASDVSEDNKLVGWVFTKANPDKTNGAYYSLGKKDDLMAFYNYTGANLSGFRARIAKNAQMMATKSLRMRFQEATAIEEIISILQNNEVYDLNGRRVMTPAKGLYIVNGKKVFIK